MRLNKFYIVLLLAFTSFYSCEEKYDFGSLLPPSNLNAEYKISGVTQVTPNGDGSGTVRFSLKATNVVSYRMDFGDGKSAISPSGKFEHRYTKVGLNSYTASASAIGAAGISTSIPLKIKVFSSFKDIETEKLLAGSNVGDSKVWYWAANKNGYAGLGPQEDGNFSFASWWNATPFDNTRSCMFENSFVFTKTAEGIVFEQTADEVFVPGTYAGKLGIAGDQCHPSSVINSLSGQKRVSLIPSSSKAALEGTYNGKPYKGTSIEISDGGMLGWWVGSSTYDIISITETMLIVRVMEPNSVFAWYHIFTTVKPEESSFDNLVWSDEFNNDGPLDDSKWDYDLGTGSNGWGNNELQSYTKNSENIRVENGLLKIIAKKDPSLNYTSARIKTQGKFGFKYGKIEVRAKLPSSQGTWPGIWMLGNNFTVAGWPKCGEIDIMEQKGNDKQKVIATTHWFDTNSNIKADYSSSFDINDATDKFHTYSLVWTEKKIKMLVDDQSFYEMNNNDSLPFNQDFFIILNLAIGGSLGGNIPNSFTEDSMEIDYVRVYQ